MDFLKEVVVVSDAKNQTTNCTIYDLKSTNELHRFKEGNSTRNGLAFIGNDYMISSFKKSPCLKIWTLNAGKDSRSNQYVMPAPGLVSCLAVTKCGSYCIAGIEKNICVWEVATGELVVVLQYHTKKVTCIRISSDISRFLSGSSDGRVLVWSLDNVVGPSENIKPRYAWMDHTAEVVDIFVSGLGNYARVATASKDMTCRLYELDTGFLLLSVWVDFLITAVVMDDLEYFLLLGSSEGGIYRINLFSYDGVELHCNKDDIDIENSFKGHTNEITSLSLSFSGRYLASGSEDGDCRIWDMSSFSCIKTLKCQGPVTNAFITLLPPGLQEGVEYVPKLHISKFERQYSKSVDDDYVITTIQPQKLSLFCTGAPDKYFDSRILINAAQTVEVFNKSDIALKDVATINSQIYSYALCDQMTDACDCLHSTVEDKHDIELVY